MSFEDQIILDSKDRQAISTSSTDFIIDVPYASKPVNSYQLVKAEIPLVYDNVTSSNNTITTPSATIPTGHYNISNLITQLNNQTLGTYTWSWEINERIKVSKDDLTTFTFDGGTANNLLGVDTGVSHTGANNYTFEFYPNLAEGYDYLTLHSSQLKKRSIKPVFTSGRNDDILTIIPLKRYEHGQILTWEPQEPKIFGVKRQHLSELDFKLKNKDGNVLNIFNRSITLVFDRRD